MSDPGIDAPSALSTGTGQGAAPSSSRQSGPGSPPSLLEDWKNWPENDPMFDPVFDAARSFRAEFCNCAEPDCAFCSKTRQAFHVSEYTADGRRAQPLSTLGGTETSCAGVTDRKVNTTELHRHLQKLEGLNKSDVKTPNHPSARLFFACGTYADDGLHFAYMRHFLAYCRIPPHFVLKTNRFDCLPVFQASYEPNGANNIPSGPQRGILHIYLQCLCFVERTDVMANLEYYSGELEPQVRSLAERAGFSLLHPTLYLRYDEASQQGDVYVADSAPTFRSLCDIFSRGVRGAKHWDPFLLVAAFLQHRIAAFHKFVLYRRSTIERAMRPVDKMKALDTDAGELFYQLDRLAEGADDARLGREISGMLRALRNIEAEHLLFLERDGNADCRGDAAKIVRLHFQRQHTQLLELEYAFAECMKGVEIVKDLLIGRAQILNGIDMAKMARDNQAQAAATEALALDARRDSEIMKRDSATMKTITVVTLVYLPATFVSTLLSMGLFDFGVGDDGNGRLRVAREGWVFLAISLPLTILTLGLALLWKHHKERQWAREAEEAKAKANAATQQQEKSTAGNGDGAPQAQAPEPPASVDAAPASRW